MHSDDSSTYCDLFQGSQLLLKGVDLLLLFLPILWASSSLQSLGENQHAIRVAFSRSCLGILSY